jgi:hypothetical protein
MHNNLINDGFAIVRNFLDEEQRRKLIAALGPVSGAGRRGLLGVPIVAALARSTEMLKLVTPHLKTTAKAVRAIYFDKSPETNWLVPWHQDLTIAVNSQTDVQGFGRWSVKDGIPHVQPPIAMVQKMVTVRIHLDDADETNGALRVLSSSHRFGRLSADRIRELCSNSKEIVCTAAAGDALLMCPLLLHASSRSTSARHRRVLHIEYAGFTLPDGLSWHEAA